MPEPAPLPASIAVPAPARPVTVRVAGGILAQGTPAETLPDGRVRLIECRTTGWPVGAA